MDQELIVQNIKELEILTPDGFKPFRALKRKVVSKTVELQIENTTFRCTEDHLLKINDEFIAAKDSHYDKRVIDELVYVYDPVDVGEKHEYLIGNIVNHNCEFIGSSGTLIAGWKLKELVSAVPINEKENLYQFKPPRDKHSYVMVVDVSRGKGLDYSAFSVFDVTKMPYEQVCTFRDNTIAPIDYASVLFRVAKNYNNAAVLVEINDIGEQVSTSLRYDFDYDNLLYTENAGKMGKRITSGFGSNVDTGVRTTKGVKSVGCSILKLLIEQNQLIINDKYTIMELGTFSKKGASYEAEPGKHDDMVMGLVLFAWLSDQNFFREFTDINTLATLREKTEEEIDQNLLPFGFVSFGDDDDQDVIDLSNASRNWIFQEDAF